jgi:hypothetical protein
MRTAMAMVTPLMTSDPARAAEIVPMESAGG